MILHDLKLIFVHIDKTGGTSLIHSLLPKLEVHEDGHHFPDKHHGIRYYLQQYDNHADYLKVAFVRNPIDRAISKYFHHYNRPDVGLPKEQAAKDMDFSEWVLNGGLECFRPQVAYVCDEEQRLLVDFIGRFENLQNDWNVVCRKLGLLPTELKKLNQSKRHRVNVTDGARRYLNRRYEKDFVAFGYDEA